MLRLRSEGVYQLPDGSELIVGSCYGGSYTLYSPKAWNTYDRAEYRVIANGQIFHQDEPTGLRVENLRDTGLAANYWPTTKLL